MKEKFIPPESPAYRQADVYLIEKKMVKFILEGFIRKILAELRSDLPEVPRVNESYDNMLREEIYRRVVDIMDKVRSDAQDMKYIRSQNIKVEFTEED